MVEHFIFPVFVPLSAASSSSDSHSLYFSKPGVFSLTCLQKLLVAIETLIGLLPIPTAPTILSASQRRFPPRFDKLWMMTTLFSASEPTRMLSVLLMAVLFFSFVLLFTDKVTENNSCFCFHLHSTGEFRSNLWSSLISWSICFSRGAMDVEGIGETRLFSSCLQMSLELLEMFSLPIWYCWQTSLKRE